MEQDLKYGEVKSQHRVTEIPNTDIYMHYIW